MKTNLVTLVILSSLAAQAELTYVKQGAGPYLWTAESAWQELPGGTAVGRVPTSSDDVSLFGAWTSALPLTIPTGTAATANTIGFGNATSGSSSDEVRLAIDGLLTTESETATNRWGTVAGMTTVVTIPEGGKYQSKGFDQVGLATESKTVITNRGSVKFNDMYLATVSGSTVTFDNYGSLAVDRECVIGGAVKGFEGNEGLARLWLHPGSSFAKANVLTKSKYTGNDLYTQLVIGWSVPGEMVVENTTRLANSDRIWLGRGDGIEGRLTIQGNGVVTNSATDGNLTMNCGCAEGSIGRLTMRDNASLFVKASPCFVGAQGDHTKAFVTMSENANVATKSGSVIFGEGTNSRTEISMSDNAVFNSVSDLTVATGRGATATVSLSGDAALTAASTISLGDSRAAAVDVCISNNAYMYPKDSFKIFASAGCMGTGSVFLAGGSIKLPIRKIEDGPVLFVGTNGSHAAVAGYGTFTPATSQSSTNTKRLGAYLRGQIIADGCGDAHDFNAATLTILNPVDEANANGNSGWYAKNKGRLFMPHPFLTSTEGHAEYGSVMIGDAKERTQPELVNSFLVKLVRKGVGLSGNPFFANLYAEDHPSVPTGITKGVSDVVLGIWNMGYSGGEQFGPTPAEEKARTFDTAEITIRHATDFASVKKLGHYQIVAYHRHDGTQWQEIARQPVDLGNPRITLENIARDTSGTCYNVGWIALVARYRAPGMILMVR